MIPRYTSLKRSQKPIRKRRKVKLSSMRYEVIDGTYKRWPDGRLEALNNPKGEAWYREQMVVMAGRQKLVCGLEAFGKCILPGVPMSLTPGMMGSASFEHGDKRGGGRRNDDPNAPKNVAAHSACNAELGSRRV